MATETYHFAARMSVMQPSATLAVSDKARQLTLAGHDVVDLGGGDPDFTTPKHIIQVAAEAMEIGLHALRRPMASRRCARRSRRSCCAIMASSTTRTRRSSSPPVAKRRWRSACSRCSAVATNA